MTWARERRIAAVAGSAYVLGVVVLVAGPWGWALNRLTVRLYTLFRYDVPIAPGWALPEHYGYLLNVLLFVPLGAALVVVTRRPWWWATGIATVASAAIEVVQWLWLDREGSWRDVVANGLGALLGAALARLVSPRAPRR